MLGAIVGGRNIKVKRMTILLRTNPWWGGKSKHNHGKMTAFPAMWWKYSLESLHFLG